MQEARFFVQVFLPSSAAWFSWGQLDQTETRKFFLLKVEIEQNSASNLVRKSAKMVKKEDLHE